MVVTRIEVFACQMLEVEVGKKEYEWGFDCYSPLWMECDEIATFVEFT